MQVGKEDPSVVIEINQETGEYLMHGMGELHLEVIENRIVTEKNLKIVASPPIVVYRETVHKTLYSSCRRKISKQTQQDLHVKLKF
jgi:elongation factor 2